ncbi:MAG: flagellar M-ring protein FliF C-terminal domain-containing protein [Planctomycetota bacterium]
MKFDWKKVWEAFKELWAKLPTSRRVGVVSLIAIGAVFLLILVTWANRETYVPLFQGRSPAAVFDVTQRLQESSVPYRVEYGTQVQVPEQYLTEWRGRLAKEGFIEDDGASINDVEDSAPSFLATESDKARAELKKNIVKLERALKKLTFIEDATVLARGEERSYLKSEHSKAYASVMVTPRYGQTVTPSRALTIRQLVTATIKGLRLQDVSVSTDDGSVIAVAGQPSTGGALDDWQLQTKARFEHTLTERAFEQLSVFPIGAVQVAISSELDFNVLESKVLESADPESKRTLEENINSENTSEPTNEGAPGPDSEFGDAGSSSSLNSTREDLKTSYAYDRKVENWVNNARYATKRLSVSILVHDSLAQQKTQIENLVKGAIGFDDTRNDTLSIEALSYELPQQELEDEPIFDILELVNWGAEALSVVAVVVMLMVLMLRAIKKQKREEERRKQEEEERIAAEAAAAAAAAEEEIMDIEHADPLRMLTQMEKAAQEDPASIARLVKHWLQEI